MPVHQRKAYAYITHRGRLLVFVHPYHPDAGIQVPGGTLEPGEDPAAGALREATEETGLAGLEVVRFLGEVSHDLSDDGADEVHRRYYFHLHCTAEPPERWRHGELTPSEGAPARFRSTSTGCGCRTRCRTLLRTWGRCWMLCARSDRGAVRM